MTIKTRLASLRKLMAEKEIDALFVSHESNVTYMSGYTNHDSYLLITGTDCGAANLFITDCRYTEQAAQECPDYEVILYRSPSASLGERLSEACQKYQLKNIYFEKNYLTFNHYQQVSEMLKDSEFKPSAELIESLRYTKDEGEQQALIKACNSTDIVFSAVCDYLRPGLTEKEIEWFMTSQINAQGCTLSFPIIVASGPRGSLPHAEPSERIVQAGDMITLDFGCRYKGYCADMTRTISLGQPANQELAKIHGIVLEANKRAEAIMKPGILGSAVDAAAREYITSAGYGEQFGHGLGHGVGLDIHEIPFMSRTCDYKLQENCFITVEPGIYLPGIGGVRIEDTMHITADGAINMFKSNKELICL